MGAFATAGATPTPATVRYLRDERESLTVAAASRELWNRVGHSNFIAP
jgi:hypothetical protein